MNSVVKAVFWVIIFVAALVTWLRYIEHHSLFFPMKGVMVSPEAVGLKFEDVYLSASDNIRLNGWFVPARDGKFTVIFFHGNAGNIGHRIEKVRILHELGLNIFIFDYRGYGNSGGSPSEKGLYNDAGAAYDYLIKEKKIPEERIILYGESIGGAVAVSLAAKKRPAALITEEAFTSIRDMAATAYPFMPHQVFSSRFDSLSKIKNIACPKLIIHSIDDEIVPFRQGEGLFAAAPEPKRFLKIRGGHNTAFLDSKEEYAGGIAAFLSQIGSK